MDLNKFLLQSEEIPSSDEPEIIILVGPPGSGKTHISKLYNKTHVIIDVDELREEPDNVDNIDESYYRYKSQPTAEKKRDEILERMVLEKKDILMHILTGSRYWYDQALNIKYSGYKIKFMFILTDRKQVKENILKKNREERDEKGYAIIAEDDFIDYSFENIPKLLLLTLKDSLEIIDKVLLSNQEGIIFEDYSKEDIYRALKTEYSKTIF